MTDRELMQMALDALEEMARHFSFSRLGESRLADTKARGKAHQAIEALRARLAQPEPEELGEIVPADEEQLKRIAKLVEPKPVAWKDKTYGNLHHQDFGDSILLYTAPPQREWQVLTDEEYELMAEKYVTNCYFDTLKYARAIEAKLKEKNHG